VLYKLKISLDEAVDYASDKGVVIPTQHMGVYEPPVSKGKKAVDANGTEGLFDSLVENSSSGTSTSKGRKLSPEEKLEKEEKRKAEKAAKDAAAALKKQHESIAKSFAEIGKDLNAIMAEGVPQEIAQAAIDKHAEKEAKKAEAQAKRDAEKAIKKAEADIKKAEAKAQKDAEKEAKKKGTVKPAVAATPAPAPVAAVAAAAAPAPVEQGVVVKRINAAGEIGKKGQPGYIYLRDSNNVVYDADTREEIGIWNGTEIVFTSQIDEEEETL
jgi:DNA polymerase III gamma/tau subunit